MKPVVIIPDINVTQIKLEDILSNPEKSGFFFKALWDTGATRSCIKPDVAKKLGIDKKHLRLNIFRTGVPIPNRIAFITLFLSNGTMPAKK